MPELEELTEQEIEKLSFHAVRLIVIAIILTVFLCIGGCIWLMWIVTKVVTQ